MAMIENYLLNGLMIGVIFGVPAGVVGIMSVQRALDQGALAGFVTGLGSSVADVVYAFVGAFGITLISDWLQRYEIGIGLVGGILVFLMGIQTFRKKTDGTNHTGEKNKYIVYFLSSFMVAITNPATVISFIFVFSLFGITGMNSLAESVQLVSGIFLGTCSWWLVIVILVYRFKHLVTASIHQKLNRLFGILIMVLGAIVGGRCLLLCF